MFNHHTLRWQHDYRGRALQNLRLLVCDECLDKPNPQLKPRVLTPDPVPIRNPRLNTYAEGYVATAISYSVLKATDQIINCTGSGGITITLPTAVFTPYVSPAFPSQNVRGQGQEITVINNTTGTVTIAAQPYETIDGRVSYSLGRGYSVGIYARGTVSGSLEYLVDGSGNMIVTELGEPLIVSGDPDAEQAWYTLPVTPVTSG